MKGFVVVLCVLLLVGAMACVQAQGLNGKSELMGAGSILHAYGDGGGINVQVLGVDYGRFFTPNLEVRAEVMYLNGSPSGASESVSAYVLSPAVLYHFLPNNPSAVIPYVGAGLTYLGVDVPGDSASSTKLQYMAGVKFFIGGDYTTATKAVFVEYRHLDIEIEGFEAGLDMVWGGLSCMW